MTYEEIANARTARIKALFELYNTRRFDEMLVHFCDNMMSYLPTVLNGADMEMKLSDGKAQYRRNLESFHDAFGRIEVLGVFATDDCSSVRVIDEKGNPGTFSFEVEPPDRRVSRVFFHHQPAG